MHAIQCFPAGIICGPHRISGIICGSGSFAVQFEDHFRFGDHFRSGDHLWSRIICCAEFSTFLYRAVIFACVQ